MHLSNKYVDVVFLNIFTVYRLILFECYSCYLGLLVTILAHDLT
jgi:hypothetical protein